jgi:hypothetical protein
MLSKEEYIRRMNDPRWYGEQDENGVDLSLIEQAFNLSYEERLIRGDIARRSAEELLRYAAERNQK